MLAGSTWTLGMNAQRTKLKQRRYGERKFNFKEGEGDQGHPKEDDDSRLEGQVPKDRTGAECPKISKEDSPHLFP